MQTRLRPRLATFVNQRLDRLVRPTLRVRNRAWSTFHVCGLTGFVLAMALAVRLVLYQGLALWVLGAIILTAVATFFALAMITKILVGEERLVYYHHEVAVLAMTILLLWALRRPVLPYLDATILGMGLLLVCGRIGCLTVGCCHGRPHAWGVRYRDAHADAGFASYLVGVRLFPIQAVEALWVLGVVGAGSALVLRGAPPGAAFGWYVILYDVGRFCFEFLRGDPKRPYRGGFSEAQWTAVLLMVLVVGAEGAGILPFHAWHLAATAGMMLALVIVAVHRRLEPVPRHRLLHPRHIREVAEAVRQQKRSDEVAGASTAMRPICTALGIQLSAGTIDGAGIDHYTLSARNGAMDQATANTLAGLILQLSASGRAAELVAGREGVFHLMIHARREADSNDAQSALMVPRRSAGTSVPLHRLSNR